MKLIKQISVFVENKPGMLARIAKVLSEDGIEIRAFTIAESGDFGIVRLVVDDHERAYFLLFDAGFTVSSQDVIGIEMESTTDALYRIASALGDGGVNIAYAYAFTNAPRRTLLIIRVDNNNLALDLLKRVGIETVSQ
ncbi:MAG: ACT domain-containing protein [Candidatus Syntrophoarchaeum butanivorans]|uniref:ACT domain-containing protein n=2 Tax=Candidatus Syntropharchaeum butanivorans TaxID=1839936 RepID=A0A1F2P6L9_9EURY|nr:MAG: ACT domain-containing protein [Candidatus Syntrophoarchaeum butanivorans]